MSWRYRRSSGQEGNCRLGSVGCKPHEKTASTRRAWMKSEPAACLPPSARRRKPVCHGESCWWVLVGAYCANYVVSIAFIGIIWSECVWSNIKRFLINLMRQGFGSADGPGSVSRRSAVGGVDHWQEPPGESLCLTTGTGRVRTRRAGPSRPGHGRPGRRTRRRDDQSLATVEPSPGPGAAAEASPPSQ